MVDWKFISEQLQQEPHCNNASLYEIGVHVGILPQTEPIGSQEVQLTCKVRRVILGWLRCNAKELGLASLHQTNHTDS